MVSFQPAVMTRIFSTSFSSFLGVVKIDGAMAINVPFPGLNLVRRGEEVEGSVIVGIGWRISVFGYGNRRAAGFPKLSLSARQDILKFLTGLRPNRRQNCFCIRVCYGFKVQYFWDIFDDANELTFIIHKTYAILGSHHQSTIR